jgi:hypothetical protein
MAKTANNLSKERTKTITGTFFRIDKDVNDDFTHKCKKSERFERTGPQSQRDMIMEELMKQYEEKGDNLFNILESNPF